MMKHLFLALALVSLLGCGKSNPAEEAQRAAAEAQKAAAKAAEAAAAAANQVKPNSPEAAAENMAKAAEGFGKAMGEMGAAFGKAQGGAATGVKPVSFRELKKRLPDEVAGLRRTSAKGSSAGQMGFNIAQAEGEYRDGKKRVDVKILDPGGFTGFIAMAAMWANVEIEEESDKGYKKTLVIDGHKAMEEWVKNGERGQLNLVVSNRFVVEISGRGVPMKDLKKALKDIDLDELKELAEENAAE